MDVINVIIADGLEYNEVDFNDLPLRETKVVEEKTINGRLYDVVIVEDEMFIVDVEDHGPTAEDVLEWQAANCGLDYWEYRA